MFRKRDELGLRLRLRKLRDKVATRPTRAYGTEDLMSPHARASSRRGYDPYGSGGNGPFSSGSIDGVMLVSSPSHPRAHACHRACAAGRWKGHPAGGGGTRLDDRYSTNAWAGRGPAQAAHTADRRPSDVSGPPTGSRQHASVTRFA
ncbi:hypothetical protein EVAR_89427_1 [Eumeta japonica]|uniref:Uncharacterized protein n=1 Tax=Eumeta variegata TaxID=151549 RepID=A0A4C1Z173_EUMVA|nr:hypothetical protein EVAR_89427_1 [Eumeta japonica]